MYTKLIYIVLFISLFSCKERDKNPETTPGYQYFPLDTTQRRVYEITTRNINLVEDITRKYFQKEQIGDIFIVGQETVYMLEKYIKLQESDNWSLLPDTVETIRIVNGKLIQTENNIRYLKLIFPVLEGRQWDGNIYNTQEEDIYTIKSLDQPFQFGNHFFEKTLLIEQAADTVDLTKRDVRFEIYGYNTGLIYKRSSRVSLNFVTGDTLDGTILIQKFLHNAQ